MPMISLVHKLHSRLHFGSVALCVMAPVLGGCLVDYYVDWVTRVVVDGSVRDAETQAPLGGVVVTLASDRLVGPGQVEKITVSAEDGTVCGEYEGKWGCRRNGLAVWCGRSPRVEAKLRLSKDGYEPVEMSFRLDKLSDEGGRVPIHLGAVLLTPASTSE